MNYYNNSFSYSTVILTASIIVALVVIVWYYYALQYRYSSERIEGKLLRKNKKAVSETQTITAKNGTVNEDKTIASAVLTIQTKDKYANVLSSQLLSLPIAKCSPSDYTCVEL